MASSGLGDAAESVASLSALLAGPDLANPLHHADVDAALLRTGEEAADRVVASTSDLCRLSDGGSLRPAQAAGGT
jgi:hypothetical protein